MSRSHLLSEINSLHQAALDAKDKRKSTISVFVEGKSDVPFWNDMFIQQGINDSKVVFGVQNKGTGKKIILDNFTPADNLLLCVDSDYDYLLQNETDVSRKINHNEFIFQTYSYSIENLYCFGEKVQTDVFKNNEFDYNEFLKTYSTVIYPLFVISFHHEREYQRKTKIGKHLFSISDFCNTIALPQRFNPDDIMRHIGKIEKDVTNKIHEFGIIPELEETEKHLNSLGITKENCYLFIKGHCLLKSVVMPLIESVLDKEASQNKTVRLSKEIISENLLSNLGFQSCFLYKKIESDFQVFKSKHEKI